MGAFALVAGCGVVRGDAPNDVGSEELDAGTVFGGSGSSTGMADVSLVLSCTPASVIMSSHRAYRPAVAPSDACVGADGGALWEEYFDVCLGPDKDSGQCATFKQENAACTACLVTPFTASGYGPVLDYGGYVGGNVAGCLELTSSDPSCAKTVQALTDCELDACEANCPVTDPTSLAAREQCAADADTTVCGSVFAMATTCRATAADAGAAESACLLGPFEQFYDAVAPLFCGLNPTDAAPSTDHDGGRLEDAADAAALFDARPD